MIWKPNFKSAWDRPRSVSSCGATIRTGREALCVIGAPSPGTLRRGSRSLGTGRGGCGRGLEFVFDLPEDLLDDVLHRQDTDRPSLSIDDRSHMEAAPPHLLQDGVDAPVLGYPQQLLHDARILRLRLVLVGGVLLAVERQSLQIDDADQVPATRV